MNFEANASNFVYSDTQIQQLKQPLDELLTQTSQRIQEISVRVNKQDLEIKQFNQAITNADLYVDSLIVLPEQMHKNLPSFNAQCTTITGRRSSNEDEEIGVLLSQNKIPYYQIYAVFDGHGGIDAARFCKENFVKIFSQNKFLQFNFIEEAIKETFLDLDQQFCEQPGIKTNVGTTCACVVFDLASDKIVIANCGDARVLIYAQNDVFVTFDHKPSDVSEQNRLRTYFATETMEINGVQRVNGSLAVSRAIGDVDFKIYGVQSKPNVLTVPCSITDILFTIVACDGLFDVISNDQLISAVKSMLGMEVSCKSEDQKFLDGITAYFENKLFEGDAIFSQLCGEVGQTDSGEVKIDKSDICGKISQVLVRAAYFLNSTDNITCIVILQK
ncbi:Protein phosphatase 2C [Spironucleus salmonicida]|uniref:Protein phosphatase 2C n=1 Tax=Spironucleus salmonicida TaxID=348837 RepID=V6M715_9EUKA|nr:Protein phosphatase 2C [Spironucleus salmonicida]|eukprot:EST49204.1 Protein phosphatase 2C [Spironucleus salmonicida]